MAADRAESPPWATALLATDGCARVRSVRLDELLAAVEAQPLDPSHVVITGHLAYVPAPERPQRCPVCKTYHVNVGEKTDAGALVRQCPLLSRDDPRNWF